jgi:hypothetical protein
MEPDDFGRAVIEDAPLPFLFLNSRQHSKKYMGWGGSRVDSKWRF